MKKYSFPLVALMFFAALAPFRLSAQHDLTLYSMDRVPQRIYLNPAFIPDQKTYFGIPFLSGIQNSFMLPFSYHNVLTRGSDDSLTLNPENFLKKIAKNSHLAVTSGMEILSVGGKIANDKFFINFGIRERMSQNVYLPENFFNILWYGNNAPQVYGKRMSISPIINGSIYDEWSFSFSGYALKNKLTYGAAVKYLSGRINVTTKKSTFEFYTDPSSDNLLMNSDLELMTSGVNEMDSYLNQRVPSLVFPGNNGFAVDFGANYQINDRFSVNFSVLDLGFISWHSRTMEFVSHEPGKEVVYDGMSLHNFAGVITNFSDFGKKLLDSLKILTKIDTVYDVRYKSNLPARFNIGGSFSPDAKNHINILLNGISWAKNFYPALSVSYMYDWSKHVGLTFSYNLFNRQYTNFGGGISVSAGPVQLYLVSDNLPGLIFYRRTNNSSFQFGINILLNGKSGNTEPPKDQQEQAQPEIKIPGS